MSQSVIPANAEQLELLVTSFDNYRTFYGQGSDSFRARQFLMDRLANNDAILFLAIDDTTREGLGFAQLYPSFSSVAMKRIWILNDLFVAEVARRSGIGRKLMDAVLGFARSSGAVRVDLATAKDNVAAKQLYESVGYDLDVVFDHYKLPIS